MDNIKFGVRLPNFVMLRGASSGYPFYKKLDWEVCRDVAVECDKLGYHSIWMNDHLMMGDAIFECWTTLSAISSITNKIRLGTSVLCNLYRYPSLLAKMAATLDVISNGRLEFGIGAGNHMNESLAYGIPFPKPAVRIARLREGLEIIRRMWTDDKINYKGKYYAINEAICEPKPLQKPYPPIMIGGTGEKMLKVVAKYADRWDGRVSVAEYKQKLEILQQHCSTIGRDFREIDMAWGTRVFIVSSQEELREKGEQWKPKDMSLKEFEAHNIIGTPERCMDRIQEYIDLGVTYIWLRFGDLPSKKGLRLFADKILKKI